MFFGRPAACSDDIWNYNSAGKVHLHLRNIEAFQLQFFLEPRNADHCGVDGAGPATVQTTENKAQQHAQEKDAHPDLRSSQQGQNKKNSQKSDKNPKNDVYRATKRSIQGDCQLKK